MGIGDNYQKLFIYSLDFNMVISFNLVPSGLSPGTRLNFVITFAFKIIGKRIPVTEHCIKVNLCLWRLIKVQGKMNWNEMQLVHTPRSKTE